MLHEVLAGMVGGSYLVLELWAQSGGRDPVVVATRYNPTTGELESPPFAKPYPPDRAAGVMARARVMLGGAA